MKIIALAFLALVSACIIPAQSGQGPHAGPQPAPQAQAQRPTDAPKPDDGAVIPGLEDLEPTTDDQAAKTDVEGVPLGAAEAQAWVTSPVGKRLCFLNEDPFLGQGARIAVVNKTDRLYVAYALNGATEPNLIILKDDGGGLWRRNDNGHGVTVLPPRSVCYFEAKHSKSVRFMAYGYVNEGSEFAPVFRPSPDMKMSEPETIAVRFEQRYTLFPLSSYRFKTML